MARDTTASTRETDEAMNRALTAEVQAREAIARCRAEAARTVEAAQARARAIEDRANRRISRVRSYCLSETENRVGVLLKERARPVPTPAEESALRQDFTKAVERLAVRLTAAGAELREKE